MMRIHWFEIEDQPWYPSAWRKGQTDFLRWMMGTFRVFDKVMPKLLNAFKASGYERWIDLCSGGGGAILQLREASLQHHIPFNALLTDLYPNTEAFKWLTDHTKGDCVGHDSPIDARQLPDEFSKGFFVMFNAFHHFKPIEAQQILSQTVSKNLPIALLEPNDRSLWQLIANTISIPILQLLVTPFLSPFRWNRLIFTYLFPAIPICTLWDGWVSVGRTYTPKELKAISSKADPQSLFNWEIGKASHPFGKVNYLIGMPKKK